MPTLPPTSDLLAASAVITKIKAEILNPIIGLLFALALVLFLWGVYQFITKADDPQKATDGRSHMIWGVVGMVIMFSAFGIMNAICSLIGCR